MSEVVTNGLRQYVQTALAGGNDPPQTPPAHGGATRPPVPPWPRLPERVAARLRELRSSGRSELLSGTLAALTEAGWPLRSLAEALGISRQAVQARVRRLARTGLRDPAVPCEPPPPFPQRRVASASGLRPHLTIKIDHTLRASAHRAAADEGSSLTQVVEAILDGYLRHGMADGDQAPEAVSRRRTRIIRQASTASTGRSPSKSP